MKRRLQPVPASAQQTDRDADRPDVLSQVEVCARLGISDQTWMRWRAAKRTPDAVTMPSGRLKWRTADIDALAGTEPERPGRRRFFQSASVTQHGETLRRHRDPRTSKPLGLVGSR